MRQSPKYLPLPVASLTRLDTPKTRLSLPYLDQNLLQVPPTVTASAWAIHDANTGDLLWGREIELKREIASLTKIMTCLLSHNLLVKFNKDVETLCFPVHHLAASIKGTHSGLKEGDLVSVLDLFHGSMLPSGNDSALTLASGFGYLLLNEKKNPRIEKNFVNCVGEFVREMNRLALRLGLKSTAFTNPHGMMNGNKSTVIDLGKLAYNALQVPILEKISSTLEWTTTITNAQGQTRKIVWRNTNKLLEKGYSGMKTGTTETAGACLSSLMRQGEANVLVTVLNCKTSNQRWVDTEKLTQWAVKNVLLVKEQLGDVGFSSNRRQKRKYIASLCQNI